jgi:hypothetical protein
MRALACVVLIACGGGDDAPIEGEPLAQSSLMGQFNNKPWTPAYGFGRAEGTTFTLFVGAEKISCADDFESPRDGNYGSVGVPAPATVGTYASSSFDLQQVVSGDLETKVATGSVQITNVGPTQVSAVFAFDLTDPGGGRYALNGAVTMARCP